MRALALVLVGFTTIAGAVDHPTSARRLSLRDGGARPSLRWTTAIPAVTLPAQSPTVVGATLRIAAQSGESATFDLPAAGWSAIQFGGPLGYVFKNHEAPGGLSAVKLATVKGEKTIRIAARATGLTLDEAMQGTVRIALIVGDDVYCSTCPAPRRDQPGRYVASRCPAPGDCALPTSTTTSSTSTSSTTTTIPGVCGDGVVNQPTEACDGADPGVCDDIAIPPIFTIACEEPGSARECGCCFSETCFLDLSGGSGCCGTDACQDTTGFGMIRAGVCIPTACDDDPDCEGNDCVDGACCAPAGARCGAVDCCPGTGTICDRPASSLFFHCCHPPGTPCSDGLLCCSESCTAGTCD